MITSDIQVDNIKRFAMHQVQMHANIISPLLYGFASVRATIHSIKLVILSSHTDAQTIQSFLLI